MDKDNNCVIFKIIEGLKTNNIIVNVRLEIKKLWKLVNALYDSYDPPN
jgi:hypothetical protein